MTTRRGLLGTVAGAGALVASSQRTSLAGAAEIPAAFQGTDARFPTRQQMSLATGFASGAVAVLAENGREGLFVLREGAGPSDPLQGLYVQSADHNSHWQRIWDGIHGQPEWFGAVTGRSDVASANRRAIQACIDLCPTTMLRGGDYYIDASLHVTKNGTAIRGTGHTQTDQKDHDAGRATRIVSTGASETIVTVGVESPTKPQSLTETVHLEGFTVDRAVPPFTPGSGLGGAIGIALLWCVNCHLERIFSLNSSRGFFYSGVVETYTRFCGALREQGGTNGANDCFVGFHFDGNAPSGYNGGNASVYLIYCRAFPATTRRGPQLTYSAGIRFDGGWVDCYIHGFESGSGIQYGIHGIGDGSDKATYRTEDLIVTNCVLDDSSKAGIRLEQGGTLTAVVISNCYMATAGATCVELANMSGAVTISGCQYITGEVGIGLSANGVKGLRTHGNIFTVIREAVNLHDVMAFDIADSIQGRSAQGVHPAIALSSCTRGKIDCTIRGSSHCFAAGVQFNDAASSLVEVCATGIDPASLSSRFNSVVYHGKAVTVQGPFGFNCLISGILA